MPTVKVLSRIRYMQSYIVSGGALNSTHSLTQFVVVSDLDEQWTTVTNKAAATRFIVIVSTM